MATVTLAQLRSRIRQRADMPDANGFVTDAELDEYINTRWAELYDLIVAAYRDDYTKSGNVTIAAGAYSATLPTDFYQLRAVEWNNGSDGYPITLRPFQFGERNQLMSERRYQLMGGTLQVRPIAAAPGTYTVHYIPVCATISSSIDVPNRWEEYIIVGGTIDCLAKEESDTGPHERRLKALVENIEAMAANRNAGDSERIVDARADVGRIAPQWWVPR